MEQSSVFPLFFPAASSHALLLLHAGSLPTSTATTIVVRQEDTVAHPHLLLDLAASVPHHRPPDEHHRLDEAAGRREAAVPTASDRDHIRGRALHATADLDPIRQDRGLEVPRPDHDVPLAEVEAGMSMRAATDGEKLHPGALTDLGGAQVIAVTAAILEVAAGVATGEAGAVDDVKEIMIP